MSNNNQLQQDDETVHRPGDEEINQHPDEHTHSHVEAGDSYKPADRKSVV